MAKQKNPSKKELIEENRVLRAGMQAAMFAPSGILNCNGALSRYRTEIISDPMTVAFQEVAL
ncbi:hypothetical protein H257_17907 [Aphanomyces astaci]|uniref:Uncharacterized protein n=1 Tax=Aphanomyces astaci TaxID=112090 RepID=W4FF63_APHAT|nr:hypothetical protein H257_17907 [Aphanomyces astaci]ETV65378.1 hypothetical protein H257_17907 [Aphanomyces astaci]|eukprot:XP_009845173.1 hypothetical protein H257_17907 [Aphanomyces astaci]